MESLGWRSLASSLVRRTMRARATPLTLVSRGPRCSRSSRPAPKTSSAAVSSKSTFPRSRAPLLDSSAPHSASACATATRDARHSQNRCLQTSILELQSPLCEESSSSPRPQRCIFRRAPCSPSSCDVGQRDSSSSSCNRIVNPRARPRIARTRVFPAAILRSRRAAARLRMRAASFVIRGRTSLSLVQRVRHQGPLDAAATTNPRVPDSISRIHLLSRARRLNSR